MAEFNDWYNVGSNKIHKTALINWDVVEIGENNIIVFVPLICEINNLKFVCFFN